MVVQIAEIQTQFPELLNGRMGFTEAQADNMAPPDQATSSSLVFVIDAKFLQAAISSAAAILVVSEKAKNEIEKAVHPPERGILFSKNVKLAMALVKTQYFAREVPIQRLWTIHPSAVIEPTAVVGQKVTIGAFSVIGANVTIGDGVRIDCSVIIEEGCKIGKNSHLYSNLYIGPRTEIGERCVLQPNSSIGTEGFGFAPDEKGKFYRIPQTGKVVLQDDVEVGANCTIDRATFGVTLVGEGTKIDKLSHIAHNCEIGKHSILAGKFAVAGSTKIGNHFISGGRVTVRDGITITDGVEIAGLSGVNASIMTPGQYGGYPIQPVRDALRSGMALVHLPQIRKNVSQIMKHLALKD
jgi:UDP-3-O-[3-hydroxymyristoyl] glucosamine N-acyltransferase